MQFEEARGNLQLQFSYIEKICGPKVARIFMILLVGARGFEPPTPCAQGRCATRLRYAPTGSCQYTLSTTNSGTTTCDGSVIYVN
jgi:hypothetical protein